MSDALLSNLSDPNCTMCRGSGLIFDSEEAVTCKCRRLKVLRQAVDRIPKLKGIGKRIDLLVSEGLPLQVSAVIQQEWRPLLEQVVGWVYAHLLASGTHPSIAFIDEVSLRGRYFGRSPDGTQKSSSTIELISEDVVVCRIGPTKNKHTAEALVELVYTVTNRNGIVWLVTAPGDTLREGNPHYTDELAGLITDFVRLGSVAKTEAPTSIAAKLLRRDQ